MKAVHFLLPRGGWGYLYWWVCHMDKVTAIVAAYVHASRAKVEQKIAGN